MNLNEFFVCISIPHKQPTTKSYQIEMLYLLTDIKQDIQDIKIHFLLFMLLQSCRRKGHVFLMRKSYEARKKPDNYSKEGPKNWKGSREV